MSSNLSFKKNCEYCGKEFEAKTLYTRYCGHVCNSRHYKKLKREEKIQSAIQPSLSKPEEMKFDSSVQKKEFLSLNETATLLGASRRTIQRMISKGTLKAAKLGSRTIVPRKAIDNLFI
ncbi:MAG: helix-turn-helix domain-containing protein [Bacteroidales bacterium]|jgi:excisionase family DNA binding protein|nr:helix-turn-helix domain-containing protein [Bacteroidales bacterium]MDD4214284.1 helix-turn-helix domain-containing protein [Bacteroidales bacterium]